MPNNRMASSCAKAWAGLVAGARRVLDGLVQMPGRGRLREVIGELGQPRRRCAVLRHAFDGLGEAAVQSHSPWRAQFAVQRLPYQCVREGEAARWLPETSLDQLGPRRVLERLDQLVFSDPGHLLQDVDVELAAHDGRHRQHAVARLAQPRQSPTDDFLDSLGKPETGDVHSPSFGSREPARSRQSPSGGAAFRSRRTDCPRCCRRRTWRAAAVRPFPPCLRSSPPIVAASRPRSDSRVTLCSLRSVISMSASGCDRSSSLSR